MNLEEKFSIAPPCSEREFLAAVKLYARAIVDQYDLRANVSELEWEVSRRAKRRAGALFHRDGVPEKVQITWEYFENEGWNATASTVRHELIHAHLLNSDEDSGHGPKFERLANQLDTDIRCESFAEPKWWIVCQRCDQRIRRYRKSKLVEHPDRYTCGQCGGRLAVQSND